MAHRRKQAGKRSCNRDRCWRHQDSRGDQMTSLGSALCKRGDKDYQPMHSCEAAVLWDVTEMARARVADAHQQAIAPDGIEIGVAELVSPSGRIFRAINLFWGLDVAGSVRTSLCYLPVFVASDVRAAPRAKARFWGGSPCKPVALFDDRNWRERCAGS